MAAALPKSELVIVGGAGHLVQLEQPEVIDDAPRPAGRARHTVQAGRAHASGARTGAQPWLSGGRAPRSCRPPRTPSRWAPSWADSCAPVTWWCCRARWARERPCWPRELREAMDVDGPVISPTFVLARVHRARQRGAPGDDPRRHVPAARPRRRRPARRTRLAGPRHRSRRRRRRRGVGRRPGRATLGQPPRHPARTRAGYRSADRDLAVEPVSDATIDPGHRHRDARGHRRASCGSTATHRRARRAGHRRRPRARRAADPERARRPRRRRDHASTIWTPSWSGCGPGPFTGLRVGMATAAAYGHALGIPVHGVCSLDAIGIDTARARCWSSPMPAAARCTGRATATVCASTGRLSTRPPMCRRRCARSPDHPSTPRCSTCRGGRAVYPTASGLVRAVADWTATPAAAGAAVSASSRRQTAVGGGVDDGRRTTPLSPPTPRDARNWRPSCSTATTRGRRGRSWPSSRPSTSATSPRAPTTSSSATPGSRGSGRMPPYEYEIHTIGVDPAYQGQGIGRR